MALVLKDRVKETCSSPGTGTVTLLGASTGYQSFAAIGDGNTTYYTIADQGGSNWEVGIGTYTASGTTLSRDTVLASSAGGTTKANFSTGTQDVFVTYTAARSVNLDAATTSPGTVGYVLTSTGDGWTSSPVTPTGSTYTRTSFTATGGQTIFNVTYTVGYIEVFLNGVLLNAADYTASNGTTVVLAVGAVAGDIVETIAYTITNVSTASTANNIAGGAASQIPYQASSGSTAFIPNGTSGQALVSNGTSAPSFGTLSVGGGGTGQTSLTSNNVILGNGASAVQFVAPGTTGNVLTSNGTTWTSAASPTSPEIKTPTNVSPANGATNIGETPTLTGSTYYSLYGIAMAAGQWQVSTVSNFATTVISTGDVAGTSVSYNVSAGVLSVNTTYYWRVRYKDANGTYSDWSTGTSFTTAAAFGPTVIGQAFGGGFYAGQISTTGNGVATHYLIVAPKSSGENSSRQWKTSNTSTSGTSSVIDGPTNSANMNNASHPAAQFCEGLTIGGFSDWYMPAKNELEVCYYNLKPTTNTNNTSSGTNTNAVPSRGSNYTSGTPAQTTAAAFQSGGAEAFAAAYYWSSTEFDATSAWIQGFGNGGQDYNVKDDSLYVRAVRRVPI